MSLRLAALVGLVHLSVGSPAPLYSTLSPQNTHNSGCSPKIVNTSLGSIQGCLLSGGQGGLAEFLGVRYAPKPIRFTKSQVVTESWKGVYEATEFGKACIQGPGAGIFPAETDEDCLFLNIWAPAAATNAPVMVYIHGGSFQDGSGNQYNSSHLANRGVVAVTINYRLGVLGQLSATELFSEDSSQPSYGGLNFATDQLNALKVRGETITIGLHEYLCFQWVKSHIAAFGGDPSHVTVFGESAGALSVCVLAASPLAAGLFQNIILESGSCIGPWGPNTLMNGLDHGGIFMKSVNATSVNDLRRVDAYTLQTSPLAPLVGPAIDLFVLSAPPFSASSPKLQSAIIGATSFDGLMPWPFLNAYWKVPSTRDQYIERLIQYFGPLGNGLIAKIVKAYPPDQNVSLAYISINADLCVYCPTRDLAEILSTGQPTYAYLYGYRPTFLDLAVHASELPNVFGFPDPLERFPFNQQLSDSIQNFWTNFAKTGSPGLDWAQYDATNAKYYNFSQTEGLLSGYGKRCDVWDGLGDLGDIAKRAFCWQA